MEWDGANGGLRHYDKNAKENIKLGEKFTFILLDQLGVIKGWNDASDSGIFSNEVKDTRQEPFIVKAFKGGVLAQGIYANIKDRITAVGGHFTTNLYVAFREGDKPLSIGSIQFKGAALREWMEFSKKNRADLYKKAIAIGGSTQGKKGAITYYTPIFSVKEVTPETNDQATELDMALQTFLKAYLARPTTERAEPPPAEEEREEYDQRTPDHGSTQQRAEDQPIDDDIPF